MQKRMIGIYLDGDERAALLYLAERERRDMRDQATLTISYEIIDCDWMNFVRLQCAFCLAGWGFFVLHI